MNSTINAIKEELLQNRDERIKKSLQSFFKEEVKLYGIKTAAAVKIGKKYFKVIKDKEKDEIFTLCEDLWQSGFLEESFIACNWSYYVCKRYEPKDFNIFEKWVSKYINNWASCDTFCNHTIGTFVDVYPEYLSKLKKWAKSKNRWIRRASAVSLIIPAKRGKFLKDIFEIADILHLDQDDLVQKGYGWMLKAASQLHQKEVFEYVIKNKTTMPRTALRYAIEKMPKELKIEAMKKSNYRQIELKDISRLFHVRISTDENNLSYHQLYASGITEKSVQEKLCGSYKGWVCEIDNKVVGFAIGDKSTGEIWVIAVLPECINRGIGTKLLSLVENWLWDSGCTKLWLETDVDPKLRAYSFYKKNGWQDDYIENEHRYMKKIKIN